MQYDWTLQVMWQILTDQSALFQSRLATLQLLWIFMRLSPDVGAIFFLLRRRFISRFTIQRCTAKEDPAKIPSAGDTPRDPSSGWAAPWGDTTKRLPLRSCPRVRLRRLRLCPHLPHPTRNATWRTWTGCSAWRPPISTSTVGSSSRWRSPASSSCTGSSTGTWATTSSTISST